MPVVTNIEPQKKQNGLYNIYIDGQYRLSLSDLDLASWQLSVNQELSQQQLDELLQTSTGSKAYNYSLRYLTLRPRSCKEVTDYLIKKGFEQITIEGVINNLLGKKYINDHEFAQMWVRNRMLLSPRSPKVLRLELYKKGIAKETAEDVIGELTENQQIESLKGLVSKKRRLSRYQDDKKLTQYLLRNGYSYSSIKEALSDSATF